MESRISKWGNSLGIRIPRSLAKEAGISENVVVDLIVEDSRIVISKTKSYNLKNLLSQVTMKNIHNEIETADPSGREIW